ncbi:MAG: hypothetical protein V4561_02770 [Bacteroidota bacterium]
MAFRKLFTLIHELKLVQHYVHTGKDKRRYRTFVLTGFLLEENILHFLVVLKEDTQLKASIRLFKQSSDKTALILISQDVIIPKLVALKLKENEFYFQFKEESYFVGLFIDRSISKYTGKLS